MHTEDKPDPATWPGHTGNWNRWPNDLGTLNTVTPEVILRAVHGQGRNRIHLLHNMNLEVLSELCHEADRQAFLFVVTSLHLERATGSLTSPVAVL